MNVIRARSAGFCMGVSLALRKLDRAIALRHKNADTRIVMLGPIIHNPQVLAEYTSRGVLCITELHHIQCGDTVLVRAHGITKQDEEALQHMGACIEDATCPKVKKAQLAIADATAHGETLLLFGEADHPEVRGLLSYAGGACFVLNSPNSLDSIDTLDVLPSGVVLAAQTTQEQTVFQEIVTVAERRWSHVNVLCTICDATAKRQQEAVDIARKVGMMVVVGGQQSGNTRRLADVAMALGTETWLVETVADLPATESLRHHTTAGLTAGASTPKEVIDAVHDFLQKIS